jgi:DNA-binding response OmpR family regulator
MKEMDNRIQPNILLVEDDTNLGFVIQDTLRLSGFRVVLAADGKEGLQCFNKEHFDLVLLDVMMPKKDGFSLAEDIRKINENVPLVFLSAKGLTDDKVRGFNLGADDYITKPFSSEELILRIKAILKRNPNFIESTKVRGVYEIGNYIFDSTNYELKIGNERKKLTRKESDLLKLLCEHRGRVMERELLANMVWGDDNHWVGRSMDVFITKLRKYLSEDPNVKLVNVHGVGFRLETA